MRVILLSVAVLALATTNIATAMSNRNTRNLNDARAISAFEAGVQVGRNHGLNEAGCKIYGAKFCSRIAPIDATIACVKAHIRDVAACPI